MEGLRQSAKDVVGRGFLCGSSGLVVAWVQGRLERKRGENESGGSELQVARWSEQ